MRRIPIALSVFFLAGSALAQTPPAAPAPAPIQVSPDAHREAVALTEMIGAGKQAQQLVVIMRTQMIQTIMRSSNKPAEEAVKIVDEVLMPEFVSQLPELQTQIVDAWAANFTIDDMKGLRAFYNTPLGQKLIQSLPTVTQQGMAAGQSWGQRLYQTAITKHPADLEGRGVKF